jgi:hypothetical protein
MLGLSRRAELRCEVDDGRGFNLGLVIPLTALVAAALVIASAEPAEAAEPVGVVVLKITNVQAEASGDFVITAAAGPVVTGPTSQTRPVTLKKGQTIEETFEFTLAEDSFDWKVVIQPKVTGEPRPLTVSGKVSLLEIVRALNEGDGQPAPYDFGPAQRPDGDFLKPTGAPVSMEFKNVRSAAVAACVAIRNYQVSKEPDYRLWFDADGDRGRDDAETVTGSLKRVGEDWCTRHVIVISRGKSTAFTLEQRDPKSDAYKVRAEGNFVFDSRVVEGKVDTDPPSDDPKKVAWTAVSVQMFGIRDSFELALGNPFLATLGIRGLEKGKPEGQLLCAGSGKCPEVLGPGSGDGSDHEQESLQTRIVGFIDDHRRFVPLTSVGVLAAGFLAFRLVRRMIV